MTDLSNVHQSTHPDMPTTVVVDGMSPSVISRMPELRKTATSAQIDPKQVHLDTLIHASVVTHLIKVDTVPDPLFALSQMQDLPEISFAAIFDDGLIALGCHTTLPDELARLAIPAVATGPLKPKIGAGLQRIENVSQRLETLVDAMAPEETLLNDELGRTILDRLSALEDNVKRANANAPDASIEILQSQMSALEDRLVKLPNPTETLTRIDAKLSELAQSANPVPDLAEQQEQIAACATAIQTTTLNLEAIASELRALGGDDHRATLSRLTDLLPQLEKTITIDHISDSDRSSLGSAGNMLSSLGRLADTDPISETIEQMGAAQRTAFARIEAAITKAVSGLAPSLDHLNARADETENMMSDWHKDLKALSQHTRSIADNTEQLPPVFVALQGDFDKLANKPAPVLDLSAQKESLADFASKLAATLQEIEGITKRSADHATHASAQADTTIATLQTLPKLITATLRHEIDLNPLKDGIASLKMQLSALPDNMNLSAINASLTSLSDQIIPIGLAQSANAEEIRKTLQALKSHLQSLTNDMVQLQDKDPDLSPIKDLIIHLEAELGQATETQDGQHAMLQDTLTGLARHFGLVPQSSPTLLPASQLAPETSLNTLRMEFADLISKRMKENRMPIGDQAQKSGT